ncbi:Aste57867_21705 [Aphanomyces stellatus]|uniref:Aste57867_21705 protein n=1 Tax=Aphanomyces stellatus TaxID=120398 RepID=A0A485LJK0_9STRA|nr:hypothetical protein As57867_021636 [Aphanomyces stellatus]VFT98374.1 Aste57867_21705 [Aphanomyces stellatus]
MNAAFEATLLVVVLVVLAGSVLLFSQYPKTRAHPGPVLVSILFASSVSLLVRAIMTLNALRDDAWSDDTPTMVAVAYACLYRNEPTMSNGIAVAFWTMFYFGSAATFWYLMLAMDLISSLSNPFLPFQANSLLHHIVAWPAAGLYVAVFYWTFSHVSPTTSPPSSVRMWMVIPTYAVLAYIVIALLLAWHKSRLLETQAHTSTRRMAKLILPFLAIFAVGGLMDICLYAAEVRVEAVSPPGPDGDFNVSRAPTADTLDQVTQVAQLLVVFGLFARKAGLTMCRRRPVARLGASSSVACGGGVMDDTMRQTEDEEQVAETPETVSISNALRKCIMKYTSMGIIESAQSVTPREHTEIMLDDYTCVETKTIVVHGKLASTVLTFRDCAPTVFQHIRTMFGVDKTEYMDSFALDQIMNECGSEGKSGNLFYFTGMVHDSI